LVRCLGGPTYSMTIHGPDEFDAPRGFSLGGKIEDAAFVVAITNFCAGQLRRWVGYDHWNKIHIVHCSVGEEFFREPEPIDPASNTLLCIGRLSAQKGQLLLVDAMHKAVQDGVDVKLVMAGDGQFGVTAVDLVTGEAGLVAQVFGAAPAVLAVAAAMPQPRNADAFADLEAVHSRTQCLHPADDFVTRNDGQFGFGQIAVDDVQIGAADAAGRYPDLHLSGSRQRLGQFHRLESATRALQHHGFHAACSRGRVTSVSLPVMPAVSAKRMASSMLILHGRIWVLGTSSV